MGTLVAVCLNMWTKQQMALGLGHSENRLYTYFFGIAKVLCRKEEKSLAYEPGSVDHESKVFYAKV